MNIELALISKIIDESSLGTVIDKQISLKYFTGKHKQYFKFIQEHQKKYGKPPTIEVFKRRFPAVSLEEVQEPIEYYCDEVREKFKHNTIVNALEHITDDINELETDDAYGKLKKLVFKVENEIILSDKKSVSKDTNARMQDYLERTKTGGITGIPTGIDKLDYMIKGCNKGELISIIGFTGTGKANPLSTPILTPNGFIAMGDIKVGDLVIGEDGKAYPVVSIFPQGVKEIYKITFADGTTSRCCKEHLWKFKTIEDRQGEKDWRVKTLDDILKEHPLKVDRQYNIGIPVNKPVEFVDKKELIIPPYVLGVLLGDGGFTTDSITLTNSEMDVIEKCNDLLKHWGEFVQHKNINYQYTFRGIDDKRNNLYQNIKELDLIHSNQKFIPASYLYASIKDRKQLLAGLFDADGSVNSKGDFSFSTTSELLVKDVMFLCRSLGYRCTFSKYDRSKDNRGIEYQITIFTDNIIFTSKKHTQRYNNRIVSRKKHDYNTLKVISIEKAGEEECQCIMVDSKEHTYIIDDFIVTHNSWIEVIMAVNQAKSGSNVLLFTTEMSTTAMMRRIDSVWNRFSYTRFRDGQLTEKELKKYRKYLKRMDNSDYSLVVEQATGGVSQISAKIDEYRPDIVYIDGGYLLADDESNEDDWRALVRIWRGLHRTSLIKNIPIIVSTQSNDKKASLKSISFGKAIAADSDIVLGIEVDEQMFRDREIALVPLKIREGSLGGKIIMNFDMDKPDWSTIYVQDTKEFQKLEEEDVPEAIQRP